METSRYFVARVVPKILESNLHGTYHRIFLRQFAIIPPYKITGPLLCGVDLRRITFACQLSHSYVALFGHTMVETPDPIRTLKLSIIGLA